MIIFWRTPVVTRRLRRQGVSDGDRHDQENCSGQGVRIHSRQQRSGVVLPPQLGSGKLRRAERGSARQLRRRAVAQGAARGKRQTRIVERSFASVASHGPTLLSTCRGQRGFLSLTLPQV